MKQLILRTPLSKIVFDARSWINLKCVPFRNPEKASAVANAIIADRLITHLPKTGDSFLDIGAHIGSILAGVNQANPKIIIKAIEADNLKADALRKSFPFCQVFNCAVGETEGKAEFYIHQKSGYNSLSNNNKQYLRIVDVDVKMLDQIIGQEKVDFIKIDIEGAELGALRGGKGILERNRPTIMFESTSVEENTLGFSAQKLWKFFDTNDYLIFFPERVAHDSASAGLDVFLDAHLYPTKTHNFFAIPAEKRIKIRDRARHVLYI